MEAPCQNTTSVLDGLTAKISVCGAMHSMPSLRCWLVSKGCAELFSTGLQAVTHRACGGDRCATTRWIVTIPSCFLTVGDRRRGRGRCDEASAAFCEGGGAAQTIATGVS
jgi:hypothetical protein